MNKWLQRTIGTASLACGIALAASGIASASASGSQPAELNGPLGTVDSLTSVTDTSTVTDLAGDQATGVVPDDAKQVTTDLVDMSSDGIAGTVKKADGDVVGKISGAEAEGLPVADGLPMVGGLTQGGLPTDALTGQVGGLTDTLPGKKVVKKVSKPEGLPVADGLPVVGGLTQGGLPVVGGAGNPVTGGGQGTDMVDGVPLVGNMVGSAVKPAAAPKPERNLGMGADLVGSKLLGKGAVGGLRDDVTRPAEDLPLVGQLPVVGQLSNAVPMGSTPLGVDKLGPKQ